MRYLICIDTKLTQKMRYSIRKIVKARNYKKVIDRCRLLGLAYNSIPIKPANMNRVAVLMGQVKSIT
jgi:hypothetical protein